MAVYTVLLPEGASERHTADRAAFLREGFAWGAFWFGPLWCLWRRAWLGLLLYVVAIVLVMVAARLAALGSGATAALVLLVHIVLGLEANNLRRAALTRRGYRLADILAGRDRDQAERSFFARAAAETDAVPAATAPRQPTPSGAIGLFEDEF